MLSLLRTMRERWLDFPFQEDQMVGDHRYRIERFIGMGSYGLAYLAIDTKTLTPCLIKQSRPSKGLKGLQLLQREAAFLKRMSHPRIPRMMDYFTEGKHEMLVMTFVDGNNIEQLLFEEDRSFTEAEAILFIRELAALVHEVHQASIVHLDVRIPNVLVRDGELYLIDFGLAVEYDECETAQAMEKLAERHIQEDEPSGFTWWRRHHYAENHSLKAQMRAPLYSSDWFAVGHMLLFLLYSNYAEEENQEERPWEEELSIHPAMISLLRLLLARESEEDSTYLSAIDDVCDRFDVGQLTFKQAAEPKVRIS